MKNSRAIKATIRVLTIGLGFAAIPAWAQAPGVKIASDRKSESAPLIARAEELRAEGALLELKIVTNQLQRTHCSIDLPKPHRKRLKSRDLWKRAKQAHVRVGWHYRCTKCEKWHQNLAGGYYISQAGLIATCYHVLDKNSGTYREGYLIAADAQGNVVPILEVLAASKENDTAILRAAKAADNVVVLPLNPNVVPGDDAWCYSDPLGRSGYFSKGIVNRFYMYGKEEESDAIRMQVSTDWAPGSSGAAVLDGYGNAIGHVSTISTAGTRKKKTRITKEKVSTNMVFHVEQPAQGPMITFHCAARAADVISLTEAE